MLQIKIMKSILLKYNRPVPRYTSYPPANFFREGFSTDNHIRLLEESNKKGVKNISVYLHTPFCKQKCHFCGCNSLIWNSDALTQQYIDALLLEIKNTFTYLDTKNRKISQIHWGGGTPNNLSIEQHTQVMELLHSCADFLPHAEIAIECNPAYLDETYVKGLANVGFNRISLGIQDFNNEVLKAINREPSTMPIDDLIAIIRSYNFKGINLDFVYGLPYQNRENFKNSIAKAIALRPDRIVTFSYAHMPNLMPAQAQMNIDALPSDGEKLDMYLEARSMLTEAGYKVIGFDHFALPNDELSKASEAKTLHRNFQGYCTRETTGQVYAFGASGITQLSNAFIQNTKTSLNYVNEIKTNGFATYKGYELSKNEQLVSSIIEAIMCNGTVDLQKTAFDCGVSLEDVYTITGFKPEKLTELVNDGLVSFENHCLEVSETGMTVVRNIAILFDPLLQINSALHSKSI